MISIYTDSSGEFQALKSFINMVSLTSSIHHTHPNKMALLSIVIEILKQESLF